MHRKTTSPTSAPSAAPAAAVASARLPRTCAPPHPTSPLPRLITFLALPALPEVHIISTLLFCRASIHTHRRVQASCYLESVPADAAVMRADDDRIDLVRQQLIAASSKTAFRDLFGTTGNVRGAFFSHGTHELVEERALPAAYIGDGLTMSLVQYDDLFNLSAQTDVAPEQVPPTTTVATAPVRIQPGLCLGSDLRIRVAPFRHIRCFGNLPCVNCCHLHVGTYSVMHLEAQVAEAS